MKIEFDNAWYEPSRAFAPVWLVRRWKKDPQVHPDEYDECQVKATAEMTQLDIVKAAISQGSWA